MRIERKLAKHVYAYGTNVSVAKSIDEIKALLAKYAADQYFAHVQRPEEAGGSFIAFVIKTKLENVPVQVKIPQIYLNGKYLEKESYRAVFLIIKSKLTEIDMGEPAEQVFLANMASKYRERLLPRIDLPMLEGEH